MVSNQRFGDCPTMTETKTTTNQPALVAIDIAKTRNEVLIDIPGRKRRRRMTVINTRSEHDRFLEVLSAIGRPVIVGFEATGNYHRAIAHRLLKAGIELRLISSVSLARTREALTNGWDKNDPKDAQVILHMLKIEATQRYYDPLDHGLNDIQELSKTHEVISKAKTEVWHRLLTHYLPLYFPEAERFRGNSRSDWFLAFLHRFPTPASITRYDEQAFIDEAWDIVGRKVAKRRLLSDIYATASHTIALPIPLESAAVAMFRMVIEEARNLIRQRNQIEALADDLLGKHPDYRRLQQIPGIGPINALTILAEAGDLRRFAHHRQFLKFCGLDLATHQSGAFRGQTRLSKYGNARLRRTFWVAAQIAIRQRENSFRDKFERYIARDRDSADLRRKALTAVAAKVARVAHALIKNGSDYRPFIEAVPGGRTPLRKGREGAVATL